MKLAAIGSNCIDYYADLNGGTAYPGGGPVNMAVYTCRLGGEAAYIGPVGTDANGQLMLDSMMEKGVDTSRVRVLPGKTAVTQVSLRDGERVFGDYDEGVLAGFRLSEEDMDFAAACDVVVCDLWGGAESQFAALRSRGAKLAFDAADGLDRPVCAVAVPNCDYLFFSSDAGETDALRVTMRELHARGPLLVTAMLGEQGSLCFDGRGFHRFGVVPCARVVDSLGAGDSYIAGFLFGLVSGRSIERCMELGAATATETLGYFGAWN